MPCAVTKTLPILGRPLIDFLDTSVLVAVFLADHQHHAASMNLFSQIELGQAFCAAHSLVETYSTLTRLPAPHRATAEEADLFLDVVCERLQSVSLDAAEQRAALRDATASGIVGGAVYDFMNASCALKVRADALFAWNLKHYNRFSQVSNIVRSPA